jgi:hypothetical protein
MAEDSSLFVVNNVSPRGIEPSCPSETQKAQHIITERHHKIVLNKQTEAQRHKTQKKLLRKIFYQLHYTGWMTRGELRWRAKVPIINLTHVYGVEIDISIEDSNCFS